MKNKLSILLIALCIILSLLEAKRNQKQSIHHSKKQNDSCYLCTQNHWNNSQGNNIMKKSKAIFKSVLLSHD